MLRAGIWKPRTRPGYFSGVGTIGLQWLQQAKKETGLFTSVEVASARHVEDALTHGVDALWIGARTTVNPFSVQEVADALAGTTNPVFIKNPLNADIELWIGAVERVAKAGVKHIGLIHRGFSVYGNTQYRNAPMWHLAIEMKRRYPELLMICDPSHIAGKRSILLNIAQKAVDLDYDGLMIESHIDPDNAWSDAKQQVTPEDLEAMLDKIAWRKESIDSPELHAKLETLRRHIDHIDEELLTILGERMKIAEKIGEYKKDNNITILQTARWNEILTRALKRAPELNLSEEFIKRYFDAVHLESINQQTRVFEQS